MTENGSSREPGRVEISSGASGAGIPGGARMPGILVGPRKRVRPSGPNTRWPQYVQYLVVVGVTALFLLLAVSMQQHHFLSGEAENFQSADR